MGDKSKIEWTDATWSPVTGCDRISPGCDHCYALTMAARLKAMGSANYQNDGDPETSGPGFKLTCHPHMLDRPLRWTRPRRIFVNSMSDLFHKDVPIEFIAKVFAVMACAPQHEFQVLTKRPQRMAEILVDNLFLNCRASEILGITRDIKWPVTDERPWGWPSANIWLGTSIETDRYSFRAKYLRNTPAAVRFISAEPLLGPLPSLDLTGIDWLIVGAESGRGSRPMDPKWAIELGEMCADRRAPCEMPDVPRPHSVPVPGGGRACACEFPDPVAFFVKQLSGGVHAVKDIEAFPVALRVRRYPTP